MIETTTSKRARRNKDGSIKKRELGTTRICTSCHKELPESLFYFHEAEGNYNTKCDPCRLEYMKMYRLKTKEKNKEDKVKRVGTYGMAREYKNVNPDTMSINDVKCIVREGDKVIIQKDYGSDTKYHGTRFEKKNATVERIRKGYVQFVYDNRMKESFCWDDVIRIMNGECVKC